MRVHGAFRGGERVLCRGTWLLAGNTVFCPPVLGSHESRQLFTAVATVEDPEHPTPAGGELRVTASCHRAHKSSKINIYSRK